MKIEQSLTLLFTVIGIISGILSNYLRNLTYALLLPIVIYFIFYSLLARFVKSKGKKWLAYNSFVTFILVWLVVWILLYNIR